MRRVTKKETIELQQREIEQLRREKEKLTLQLIEARRGRNEAMRRSKILERRLEAEAYGREKEG